MKIAIIGAGASGLTAAHTLKKLGYTDITVFEKENRPGGKVFSYEHQGRPHELGAVWFGDHYKTIVRLAKEFNIPYHEAIQPDIYSNNSIYSYNKYIFSNYNPLKVVNSLFQMWKMQRRFPELKKSGYANVHKDLHMPLKQFTEKYKFGIIAEIVASFMTGCGYGYYEHVPAMYLLKLITEMVNGSVRGRLPFVNNDLNSFTKGWQSLWQAVADTLDVRYNSEVKKIRRYEHGGKSRVDVVAGTKPETFDAVFVSAPLDLAHKFMDLSETENDLFSKIKNYDYAITLIKGDNIPNISIVDNISPDTMGKVTFMAHHWQDVNVYSAYQLLPDGITEKESIQIIKDTVDSLGGTFHEIVVRKKWSYFPHVTQEELDNGFYEKLESLQGVNGTYYIGGLMNFETVENAAKYAKDLVDREFGS